jgi:hypothetical protein
MIKQLPAPTAKTRFAGYHHMKIFSRSISAFFLGMALASTPLSAQETTPIPSSLRGEISCDQATIDLALALQKQGWMYIMPQPKSPQAAWGNTDGRTTWFVGYWSNKTSQDTSVEIPVKNPDGVYVGDGKGFPGWRRGGTPPLPTKLQWLCSTAGGIAPE